MAIAHRRAVLIERMVPEEPRRIDTNTIARELERVSLGIGQRTLERQLAKLAIFHGWIRIPTMPLQWSWRKGTKPRTSEMDPYEAFSLALAAEHISQILPRSVLRHLQGRIEDARRILVQAGGGKLSVWLARIKVLAPAFRPTPPSIAPVVLDSVCLALLEQRRIRAQYKKRGAKAPKPYELNPIGLVVRGSLMVLVASKVGATEGQQFYLHRFVDVEVTPDRALPPLGFDLDAFVSSGALALPQKAGRIRVVLAFNPGTAPTIEEATIGRNQKASWRDDGWLVVEADVVDTLEFRAWVLSFGGRMEVISPRELCLYVANQAKAMAGRYADCALDA